jgi:serine kinase of HPr protein (carbohydrate metabolism regulator)
MGEDAEHASVVRVDGRGVLIRGASGSGKSALVLALLYSGDSAVLVADDRVYLAAEGGGLMASAPESLAGLLEVRGVGIVRRPYVSPVAVDLVVDLLPLADCPRLPDEQQALITIRGVVLRRIYIATEAADGALRVRAALADAPA